MNAQLEYIWLRYKALMTRAVEERSDFINPLCMLVLSITGVFFIFSAQSYSNGTDWTKQIVFIVLGAAIYILVSSVNYKLFLQNAHLIYGICVLLLLPLVIESLFFDLPLVKTMHGSTRWINVGIQIQPSELAKIGTLLICASMLARSDISDFRSSIRILSILAVVFFIPFLLIFLQPDLGSCLVLVPMLFSLLYVSRLSQRFFVTLFSLFVLMVAIVGLDLIGYHKFLKERDMTAMQAQAKNAYGSEHSWLPLKDYQRNRLLGFFAPDVVDPRGIGISWNRNQALIAAAQGRFTGKGHNNGTQAKLGYLPSSVAHNDFIFPVILEETGYVGGVLILSVFTLLMANTLRIAGMARDRFGTLLCIGVSTIFMLHIFVNIGMSIGIMPITGLPLPFLSYGGSFLLVCCILQGLIQSVYRFRRDFT